MRIRSLNPMAGPSEELSEAMVTEATSLFHEIAKWSDNGDVMKKSELIATQGGDANPNPNPNPNPISDPNWRRFQAF